MSIIHPRNFIKPSRSNEITHTTNYTHVCIKHEVYKLLAYVEKAFDTKSSLFFYKKLQCNHNVSEHLGVNSSTKAAFLVY